MPSRKKSRQPVRTCILVMGMHRSGTSALGGTLSLLGCDLPTHPIRGDANNRKGYFESAPINALNEELLATLESSWHDWRSLDRNAIPGDLGDLERRALALLKSEFGSSPQFVFKDPRICRLAWFWLPLIKKSGARIVAIHTLRSPWEVAASLNRRDGFSQEKALLLWLRYVLDGERATRDLPRTHTLFNELLGDWRGLVARAQEELGLIWQRPPAIAATDVDEFLSQDLRTFGQEAPADNAAWDWVRQTYDILQSWAVSGEKKKDHAVLDRILKRLDAAEPTLAAFLARLSETDLRIRQAENEAVTLLERVRSAEAGWQAASDQLAAVRAELSDGSAKAHEDAAQLNAELARAQQTLQARNDELTQALSDLESLHAVTQGQLIQREKEAQDAHRALIEARAALDAAEARTAEDARRHQEAQAELDAERRAAQERDETHAREILAATSRYVALEDRLSQTESALIQREKEAEDTHRALLEARASLDAAEARAADNARRHQEVEAELDAERRAAQERGETHARESLAAKARYVALEHRLSQAESALIQREKEAEDSHRALIKARAALEDADALAQRETRRRQQTEAELDAERCARLDSDERLSRDLLATKAKLAAAEARYEREYTAAEEMRALIIPERLKNAQLQEERQAIEQSLARTVHERNALSQEVMALRQSTSWRVTSPLRALASLLRRH